MHASMVSRYERSKAENLLLLLLFVLVFSSRPFLLFVLSAPKNVQVAFLDIDLNVVFVNFKFLAFCSKSTSKSHELAVDLGLFLSSFADVLPFFAKYHSDLRQCFFFLLIFNEVNQAYAFFIEMCYRLSRAYFV